MKLRIRQSKDLYIARVQDIDAVLHLANEQYLKTPYSKGKSKFDHRKVRKVISDVITGDQQENIILCLAEGETLVGALGATTFNPLWNNDLMAAELFFFCKHLSGVPVLVDAYEEWARSIGCKAITMGLDKSKRRLFKGFVAAEQMYIKEL